MNTSAVTNETEGVDYITLGCVRVPLLHLITKNSGIDGEFVILDDFKQKMGALKIRVTLNHHNTQRPLFTTSSRLPNQLLPTAAGRSGVGNQTSMNGEFKRDTTLIDKSVNLSSSLQRAPTGMATI